MSMSNEGRRATIIDFFGCIKPGELRFMPNADGKRLAVYRDENVPNLFAVGEARGYKDPIDWKGCYPDYEAIEQVLSQTI